MANPELHRDSPESDWVEYLQGLLVARLQSDSDAGSVQLSKVDGIFGPITEASVQYFQQQNGLSVTGVVDDATWQALEGTAPAAGAGGSGAGAGSGNPIDLKLPLTLELKWQDTTLEEMGQHFSNFDLKTFPAAKLDIGASVGKLVGNGGLQLINTEIRLFPNWWLQWSTKAAYDFSKTKGISLGTDNHAELGVRPLAA